MRCPTCEAWRESQRMLAGLIEPHVCEPTPEQLRTGYLQLATAINPKGPTMSVNQPPPQKCAQPNCQYVGAWSWVTDRRCPIHADTNASA